MRASRSAAIGLLLLGFAASSSAQDLPPVDLNAATGALRNAIAAMDTACATDRTTFECQFATAEATPLLTTALATIGETGDRAAYAEGVRSYLQTSVPEVRAAAAFALSQLFPDATDTPYLIRLLREPIPGVRLAAIAALLESSDPVARILAERAGEETNLSFDPQPAPYDPTTIAALLPPDAAYVEFERDDVYYGTLFFTTSETPDQALARLAAGDRQTFAAQALPGDLHTDAALVVLDRPNAYADARAVVLDAPRGSESSLIAFVYRDVQLGMTGIALAYDPDSALPRPPRQQAAEPVVATVTLPAIEAAAGEAVILPAPLGGTAFTADAAATADDNFAYLAMLMADGAGAAAYLENFPAGAYRAEVQAILDTRLIVELAEYRVAPSSQVVVTLYNMRGDPDDHLSIMPPGTPDDQYLRIFQTGGFVDGTVTIEAPSRTGERELRVYFGDTDIVQKRIRLIVDPAVTADNPLGGAAVAEASATPTPTPAPTPNPGPGPTPTPAPAPTPGGPPTLAVVGTPIYAGQRVVINYSGFAGNEREWVTFVAPGAADTAYAGYTYTTGQAGTVTYPLVLAAGSYELRAVAERPTLRVIARVPIEVVAITGELPGATIGLAQPAAAGQPIQVRFAGVPDMPGTWITIIREGAADTEWGAFVRAPAGNAGEVTLQAQPAGRYELRFLSETPSRVVIARLPITIE